MRTLFWATLALCACKDKSGDDTAGGADSGANADSGGGVTGLEILGDYTDNYGGDHQITNETWTQYTGTTIFHISQYDNDGDFLIAQNDAANTYSPELWSRFDWTTDGAGTLYYCQSAYDAADEATALATQAADPADPATTGCSSFAWTTLTPVAR